MGARHPGDQLSAMLPKVQMPPLLLHRIVNRTERSALRAGKLRAGLEIQPDFQLPACDVHLALDHFPPTAQSQGFPEKNICVHTRENLPSGSNSRQPFSQAQRPLIPSSPRTPAAASGAGFGGAKPPSNRSFPPTQNVEELYHAFGVKGFRYLRTRYEGGEIIFELEPEKEPK